MSEAWSGGKAVSKEDEYHSEKKHFRHSDKEGRQLPKELTNSLDEKPLQVKRIVMVQDDLEHNKEAVSKTGKTSDGRTDGEKKTMSEELEELWEEVVEEILDSVNPEDD